MTEQIREDMAGAVAARAKMVVDPAGREVRVLMDQDASAIADQQGCGIPQVYRESLELGITPYRYLRNRDSISLGEQLRLACCCVAVVGAGGLGGHVILLLARIGVGRLVVVDGDVFDETNLNRQALCTMGSLGRPKAEEARRLVGAVNPGVEVEAHSVRIEEANAGAILGGSNVVVDALDNVKDRMLLGEAAKGLKIPLVHGALAGFEGQVMTVFSEDRGLPAIYGDGDVPRKDPRSPEAVLGVPALMPSMVATLQAMEVIKILLGRGRPFRSTLVHIDLERGEMEHFRLREPDPKEGLWRS